MDLGPLLNAHGFLRVERPPKLWEVEVDDVALVRALGEMIAAALVRGTELGDVVLRVNNVTVEVSDEPEVAPHPGDYVALSIVGRGDWRPERTWSPGVPENWPLGHEDLDRAVREAGIPFGYIRCAADDSGSVTVFLPRLVF